MSTNKTRPTDASVHDFLDGVDDPARRADCDTLVEMMREITGEEPVLWGPSMVGFGTYHYVYDSGREGDFFLSGFSPRKRHLAVYLMAGFAGYEELLQRLGRHKTGKSCLYVKRLSDIDLDVLRELVASSVERVKSRYA